MCIRCGMSIFLWQLHFCAYILLDHDKWVPVGTAWCILRLQIEEQSLLWRVAVNMWNKQSQTADKVLSSILGVGCVADNSLRWKLVLLWNRYICLGPGILGASVGQGNLTTVVRELVRYKSDLVGVQEVR